MGTVLIFPQKAHSIRPSYCFALPECDERSAMKSFCEFVIASTLIGGVGFFLFAFGALFHLWHWWA